MGCVNGVSSDMKSKIKKMLKIMSLYEEKIDFINQKFLNDLQRMVNPDNYYVDEQIILVVENKIECETICSQIECSVQREKNLIEDYQKMIAAQNLKIEFLVNQAVYLIENNENISNNMEYLILKQYIQKFQQNGFSFKIITIQQINQKECQQVSLDNIGTFCESVIIQ
ncbi:hypothetical protein TTHERM_01353160 (macronuclear) [Tetrahymena thermophila SB210]|uniref:Uncharacterized protein n=1 Tax=Tetrahymena thermophila (strain SB210) TaxID=312017 RepID=Q23KN1_TETTS|nr:hypothetical protein TTHERM_01353160 [Tetrahymena thermophila SB210]EAR97088.1 hypothetical protein TTHERM_01353160 [Tetrahymena thermophila SB210]|eukprot:XP_001017333.1 hypothetical protein TTHERM_01353160 [Tetrahymena thermophila SB210]